MTLKCKSYSWIETIFSAKLFEESICIYAMVENRSNQEIYSQKHKGKYIVWHECWYYPRSFFSLWIYKASFDAIISCLWTLRKSRLAHLFCCNRLAWLTSTFVAIFKFTKCLSIFFTTTRKGFRNRKFISFDRHGNISLKLWDRENQ